MKSDVREGLRIKCKNEEREFVSKQEEGTFWQKNLLGTTSVKSISTMETFLGCVGEIIEIL